MEDRAMLKRILASSAVLALVALPLAAQESKMAKMAKEATITGQVIDLNCYTAKGASGEGHKMCAQACAKAGVTLALLGNDGTIYVPISSKPADPQNSRLVEFAESKVTVTGTQRMEKGLHTIEIKTITAAS
jgi:hypothetical protein